jgi:pyruvate formate lyase activating enzyme
LTLTEKGMIIDRDRCIGCGDCARECPGTALELQGEQWAVADLVSEVLKDRAYIETSGGGVTLSGGEPTFQAEFASAFLKALREKGLHTALDTCGLCSRVALDQVLPYAALVLFDIKLIDPDLHRNFTGHDNRRILDNLLYLADYMRSHVHPSHLWIRTPLIPGVTATQANITGIGRFIEGNIKDMVDRWELCAFNNLCRDKYLRLNQPWMFAAEELLPQSMLDELLDAAKSAGPDPDRIFVTGAARLEPREEDEHTEKKRITTGGGRCMI